MLHGVIGINLLYSWSQSKQTILELELIAAQKYVHNKFKMVLCYPIKGNSQGGKSMYFGFLYYADIYGEGMRQL